MERERLSHVTSRDVTCSTQLPKISLAVVTTNFIELNIGRGKSLFSITSDNWKQRRSGEEFVKNFSPASEPDIRYIFIRICPETF